MNGLPPMSGVLTFVEVAEAGAFNVAARKMDMTASAASKAVSRLEEDLGVKLLHRTTRSVSLTPEGERYLDGVRPLLAEFGTLREELTSRIGTPSGELVVSVPAAFGRIVLMPRLLAFRTRYPRVRLELRFQDRLVELVPEGIDIAIRAGDLADSASLIARKLCDDQMVTCAAPDYLARVGTPIELADLDRFDCLRFRNDATARPVPWIFLEHGQVHRYVPGGPVTATDGQGIAIAVAAGLGLAQMPYYMAEEGLKSGALVEVFEAFRPKPTPFHAVFLGRRLMPQRVRVFIDFLVEIMTGRSAGEFRKT